MVLGARTLATAAGSETRFVWGGTRTATIAACASPTSRPSWSPPRRSPGHLRRRRRHRTSAPPSPTCRDHDVTFEEGAVDDRDLAELDAIAVALDDDGTDVKIVVLADPVGDEFSSTRDFAEQVLDGLGGDRRVIVFDPGDVGIASSVDPPNEIEAGRAGRDRRRQHLELVRRRRPGGCRGAAGERGERRGPSAADGRRRRRLPVGRRAAAPRRRRGRRAGRRLGAATRPRAAPRTPPIVPGVQGAEVKVREVIDRISRRVLDLADRVKGGEPAEAARLYEEGSDVFLDLQDDLEAADTRSELEAVWPRIVDADWKLASAEALLEGQPAPPGARRRPAVPAARGAAPAGGSRSGAGRAGARARSGLVPAAGAGSRLPRVRRQPVAHAGGHRGGDDAREPPRPLDAAASRADGRRRVRRHLRRPRARARRGVEAAAAAARRSRVDGRASASADVAAVEGEGAAWAAVARSGNPIEREGARHAASCGTTSRRGSARRPRTPRIRRSRSSRRSTRRRTRDRELRNQAAKVVAHRTRTAAELEDAGEEAAKARELAKQALLKADAARDGRERRRGRALDAGRADDGHEDPGDGLQRRHPAGAAAERRGAGRAGEAGREPERDAAAGDDGEAHRAARASSRARACRRTSTRPWIS